MIETFLPFGVVQVYKSIMLKWLVTLVVVLVIVAVASPELHRRGLGRLPGDLRIPVRGRVYYVPVASTLVLCALMWLVGKVL